MTGLDENPLDIARAWAAYGALVDMELKIKTRLRPSEHAAFAKILDVLYDIGRVQDDDHQT